MAGPANLVALTVDPVFGPTCQHAVQHCRIASHRFALRNSPGINSQPAVFNQQILLPINPVQHSPENSRGITWIMVIRADNQQSCVFQQRRPAKNLRQFFQWTSLLHIDGHQCGTVEDSFLWHEQRS